MKHSDKLSDKFCRATYKHSSNSCHLEPKSGLFCRMAGSTAQCEYKALFAMGKYHSLLYLRVELYWIPLLLGFKVTAHYLQWSPHVTTLKWSVKDCSNARPTSIDSHNRWIPLLRGIGEYPSNHITPPPPCRVPVTLHLTRSPFDGSISSELMPKQW